MSNDVLVVAEVREGELKKVTLEMIGKGREIAQTLGGGVNVVLLGSGVSPLADKVGHYGVQTIYLADDPVLKNYTPEGYTKVFTDLIKESDPAVVLLAASTRGKDLAPRMAARLAVGLASDCTDIEARDGHLLFTRPIYAGKAMAKVVEETKPQMATVRPNIFPAPGPDTFSSAEVENIPVHTGNIRARVIEMLKEARERVELTEADIIISGGRGMKGPESFALLEELANVLGAAVGASRAVVDAGWRDHSYQVGQTGKVVTPTLYIACGISGAIQHLAGMKTSKYIVAINKDPEAPIFKMADYGIVGDLFKVVPVLTEEFKKMKAEG